MRNIKLSIVLFIALSASLPTSADEIFTIYLIRHAEKVTIDKKDRNPPLSKCGMLRAKRLADMLNNITFSKVYSTDYKRTQSTAAPIAQAKNMTVTSYNPHKLKTFSQKLQHDGQDVLVVGHSNTTNVVASLLAHEKITNIDEREFDLLFQVTLIKNGQSIKSKLQILNQGFVCVK